MHRVLTPLVLSFVLAAAPARVVRADVIDASAGGFTVKSTAAISATPMAVYETVVKRVGSWWDPEHTWSGSPRNMSIEPRAGGCFCEKLTAGGSVQHMSVLLAEPGKTLRMAGGLGPIQEMPVSGVLTLTFAEVSGGARVELTYTVGGYAKEGLSGLAPIVDQVLATQVARLKRFVETGKP
jgi:hypothetical protein